MKSLQARVQFLIVFLQTTQSYSKMTAEYTNSSVASTIMKNNFNQKRYPKPVSVFFALTSTMISFN